MDLHQVSTQAKTTSHAPILNTSDTRISGLWLVTARVGWVTLTLIDLLIFVLSIPAYAAQLHVVCTTANVITCHIGRITPGNAMALTHLGIALDAYSVYILTITLVASFVFLSVGAIIFWRKSRESIGLFVSLLLITFGCCGSTLELVAALSAVHPGWVVVQIIDKIAFLIYPALGMLFYIFPDGRFVPRWSWLFISLWIIAVFLFNAPADSPFSIGNWPPMLFAAFLLVTFGNALGVQVYRYRRVSRPEQRQQTKWFVFACVIAISLNILYNIVAELVPAFRQPDSLYQLANATVAMLFFLTIPLALGVAILRYRLWDIDIIINRTLVYSTLTVSVIGLYVLVVVGLGTLMQAQGNVLLSLLATGLIAVLFQPLRFHLQRGVNRLLYGERDDPYVVLARLGSRLEATLVPEKVLPTIVDTVAQVLKLPYVAITLLPEQHLFAGTVARSSGEIAVTGGEVQDIVVSFGTPVADQVRVPLIYQAETIGHLLLAARTGDRFSKADARLLADLARQAGVAVYAARLTAHLQHLTVSLQESREHLVTTREEERRRLRRDLHDGLGPTLASLTFKVDAARNVLTQDSGRAETLLVAVRQQTQEAITEIRRLVYNLRPPALDELGLLSALREQVTHYQHQGLEIIIDVPSSLPPLLAAVEVAVYRIVQEALTNVARHAEAQHCLLRLHIDHTELSLDITDDGKGIPTGHRIGIGLHAMHERASELGGSCTIIAGSSGGTTIQVRLPLAAKGDSLPASPQNQNIQSRKASSHLI